jgi:peptidyl-tRNA hydrolase, PTH1 family
MRPTAVSKMIKLLVGLGNPGPQYMDTHHNAGFWWIDAVARELKVTLEPERSCFGLMARVNRSDGPLWLLEPQTFMNLSGKSVAALARYFKIEPQEILVAHDELDLLPGQIKIKCGGGHAGHNGLRDIHSQLGSAEYWRLRLGIGHPGVKAEVVDYVLRKPKPEHRAAITEGIARTLPALDWLLAGEMEKALMRINAKPPRPKSGLVNSAHIKSAHKPIDANAATAALANPDQRANGPAHLPLAPVKEGLGGKTR